MVISSADGHVFQFCTLTVPKQSLNHQVIHMVTFKESVPPKILQFDKQIEVFEEKSVKVDM